MGGERRQFQKSRTRINQQVDPFARQHLAARCVARARGLAASAGDLIELVAKLTNKRAHGVRVAREIG